MSARKIYYALLGAIGVCVLILLGGVYVANSLLKGQAKHLTDAQLKNLVLEEKQQQLTKQLADIEKYKPLSNIAQSIVPQDKDQAQTVREIVSIAETNGVKLGSITFPTSSLGGTGAGSGNTKLSQLKPVKGISGVYSLDITIQSDAGTPTPYNKFINFLDALEHNRRTALVNGTTLQPDVNNPNNLTFTLIVSEYLKP